MRKWNAFAALLFATTSALCQEQDSSMVEKHWIESTRLTAIIDSRTSFEFNPGRIQKTELIIRPEFEILFSKNLRFVAVGRMYTEMTDRLESAKPEQDEVSRFSKRALIGDRLELELREFYFDWKIKKHYLTVGKQQIVWGKADGLKILDVVNPINLREFLLDDFENSRIPEWSLKADVNMNKIKAQLVWIPDLTYHDIPEQDYPFFPAAFFPPPPPGVQLVQVPLNKPDEFFNDSDGGVRFSSFISGWDLTLNYLYKYDDFPVAFTRSIDGPDQQVLTVAPTYSRYHLTGTTFSNAFKSFTLRGEIGFYFNRSFMTTDPTIEGGVFKTDQIAGVLGLDYSGLSNTVISTQFFADRIMEDIPTVGRQQLETNLTLLVSRNFKNETITAEFIAVQNLNKGDGFVRPKLKWLIENNLTMALSGDIIYGDEDRLFGQFSERTRATFHVQWGI